MRQLQIRNPRIFKGEKKLCDRCGFMYYKKDLQRQYGLWVCKKHCIDEEHPKDSYKLFR